MDQGIKDPHKSAIKIQIAVGKEGLKKIDSSRLTPEEQLDPAKLWDLFERPLNIRINFRIHRLELMQYRQQINEHR